jgi:signal transduction histidine kinase
LDRAFPVLDENGNLCRYVGLAKDITERKNAEQMFRDLSKRLARLQDEERRRIARELHDSSGQNLAALRMNLALLVPFSQTPEMDRLVAECIALADTTLEEIRTVSHLLHPPLLDELGLESALRSFTRGFSERSGTSVDLEIGHDLRGLPPELETAVFRIVQEGLTNTHRHARATRCWITLRFSGGELLLELRDNGVGLPAGPGSKAAGEIDGVGLTGMRDRARELGGRLTIESEGGCVVRAAFPAAARRL